MSDRPDSTASTWQELEPLRHTFYRHIFDPKTAEALRRFGSFFFQAVLEFTTTEEIPQGSEVARDLDAVAKDLRYLEQYLVRVVGDAARAFELSTGDAALAGRAEAWAARLGLVAGEIEGTLNGQ